MAGDVATMPIAEDRPAVAALSPEQRSDFYEKGYFVIRDAISPDLVERLVAACDRLIASDERLGRDASHDGKDGFRNLIVWDDVFLELLAPAPVLPLIAGVLGSNIQLLSSQLIYLGSRPPDAPRTIRTPERTGWHRDLYGPADDLGHDAVPRLAVKCAYYLTDVAAEDAGMTLFAPGSHRLREPMRIPPGAIDPDVVERPRVAPGDAVVFENRTWHAGGVNTSGRTRKAIMMQYGYRWLKPVDYVAYPEDLLERLSPIERQLLGREDRNPDGSMARGAGSRPLREWMERHGIAYVPRP